MACFQRKNRIMNFLLMLALNGEKYFDRKGIIEHSKGFAQDEHRHYWIKCQTLK